MTPLEIKGAVAAVVTSVVILVRHLLLAESIGTTVEGKRNLEASRLSLKTWPPKDGGFSCEAVLNAMVGTQMGVRTLRAF
jgi:hypothetical protein